MRKFILLLLLLCLHCSARGQTQYAYRYWFDGDISTAKEGNATSDAWHMEVDVSQLRESFHTIHLQVTDGKGVSSIPLTRNFFLSREGGNLQKGFYWFDNEETARPVNGNVQGTLTIDLTDLHEGFHTLHYQVQRTDGSYSQIETRSFYKVQGNLAVGYLTFICYIDGEPYLQERVSAEDGKATWLLDVSALPIGFHKLQVRAIMENGASTTNREAFFLRNAMESELNALSCVFSIDGKEYKTVNSGMRDGVFHCDLDVASLSDGLHKVSYILTNGQGAQTTVKSQYFIKQPVGGNSIKEYKYWLNDHRDKAQLIVQDKVMDPLKLITLLPVESQPLRSSLFHFELKDGQPMVYAKNEIHLCFYDVTGRLTYASDQYIDYNVGQEVIPVGELQATQKFAKIAENDIRWYTMPLEFGDSIAFKSNMACSIQVFSPSGEEVYSAFGSQSTSFNGCHVFANGTYYMCIHDVKGTLQADIKLDYQKIDQYAILSYTPKAFGVPSTVNISLEGNGFLDGIKVYLSKDETLIKANTLTIEDISHATASFIFDSIPLGKYDLRVVFAETDSITIDEAVSIEEGDSLPDVKIAIEGSPTFLSGSSAAYNIRFTNHSNIPVFFMPFTLTIDCNGRVSNLPYLKFKTDIRQQIRQEMRMAFFDQCTPEELKALEDAVFGDDDLSAFYLDTISVQGKTYLVGDFILPRLDGHSTLTIPFTIKGVSTNLICYAFADSHWSITELVNIASVNGGGSGGSEGGSGSGDSGGGSGSGDSGSGNGSGDSGGGSGSGDSGSGNGSGDSGSGSGSGDSGSGNGSGDSGSGSGSGYTGGGNGSRKCKDPCAIGLAIDCFQSIVESVDVVGSIGEAIRSCAVDQIKSSTTKAFSDFICEGKMPDLSGMQKNPKPVVMDITVEYLKCLGIEAAKKLFGGRVVKTIKIGYDCFFKPLKAWVESCPNDGGGAKFFVTPVFAVDPNEIYGYVAESGSKAIKEGQTDVFYTIQFENDTVFATAPAHDIYLTDTLDVHLFDLSSYRPTRITIGNKSMELTGERNFISTMDMRPEINAIAQIEGTINDKTGIVRWHISSLDPMTMEPSDDPMVGVLPVNFDGSGLGEASFDISLKPNLPDGTIIPNRSGNVFDNNETVLTPTWVNTVDAVAPTSRITEVEQIEGDSLLTLHWTGEDARSGIWYYDVYAQMGAGSSWELVAEHVTATECNVRVYEDIEYGFCVVATDMAGNRERKALQNELLPDNTTGVETVGSESNPTSGELYDLSGRRSDGRRTGVYIQGGKLWYFKR